MDHHHGAWAKRRLERHDSLGSTNDEALERARGGDPGNLWIVARRQTRGKGRLGRHWASPEGNLHASVLLRNPCEASRAPELGFVAGLALARAVEDATAGKTAFFLKWPNDLVGDGGKFAGILVEGTRTPGGDSAAVLGFGVNCAVHPSGLDYPVTNLSDLHGAEIAASRLLALLMERLDETLSLWARGEGFAAVRVGWLERALPKGSRLTVKRNDVAYSGCFDAIDERGCLRLATPEGMMTVAAGDVFVSDPRGPAARGPGS